MISQGDMLANRFFFLLSAFLLTTPAFAVVHGQDASGLTPKGVIALENLDVTGMRNGACTGVMIDKEYFLTAKHCVDGGGFRITVVDNVKLSSSITVAQDNVVVSKDLDLAMGRIIGGNQPAFSEIQTEFPAGDKTSEVRGYGLQLDANEDSVAMIPPEGEEKENYGSLQLSSIEPADLVYRARVTRDVFSGDGDSGAPVYDSQGKLAGILWGEQLSDELDQWGNNKVENRATRLDSTVAADFIERARAVIAPLL